MECSPFRNWLALAVMKSRWPKPFLRWALPEMAYLRFSGGECLAVDPLDVRGPSFHMAYGRKNPEASLSSYEPQQRALTEEYLRRKSPSGRGLVFLDIGANIGLFTFSAKRKLPELRIFAFEPFPASARCLRETVQRNHFSGVQVEEMALGQELGRAELFLDESDTGGHTLIPENLWDNKKNKSVRVERQTLDQWAKPRLDALDFIKMDVQGAEEAVLRGGQNTLARFRPALLIEVQHESAQELIAALKSLPFAYRVESMSGEKGGYRELAAWCEREFQKGIFFADYLFLP